MRRLLLDGVPTRRGVMAIHREPSYAGPAVSLPHTEAASDESMMLPLFAGLTDEQQDHVIGCLATHVTGAARREPEPLLIVGGGGFARETLELVARSTAAPAWRVAGILDDDPRAQGAPSRGVEVIGAVRGRRTTIPMRWSRCAWPRPATRRAGSRWRRGWGSPAERYATLVHPTAVVPRSASIGRGSVLHAGVGPDRRRDPRRARRRDARGRAHARRRRSGTASRSAPASASPAA